VSLTLFYIVEVVDMEQRWRKGEPWTIVNDFRARN